MARLKLHEDGRSFFDVKLAQRGDGVHALASLRIPKGRHCSGLVIYDDFEIGRAEEALCLLKQGRLELSHENVRFVLIWSEGGEAIFEARCDTGAGVVAIKSAPQRAHVERFAARLASILRTMAKKVRIYCGMALYIL